MGLTPTILPTLRRILMATATAIETSILRGLILTRRKVSCASRRSQIAPTEFFLQFKATSNRAYSVVYRTDNQSTNWIKIGDFRAAPTSRLIELTNTVPPGMTAQRFYNVVTPPIP